MNIPTPCSINLVNNKPPIMITIDNITPMKK